MKISKQQLSNLALLLFAALILFTPVGTTIKIWVNRLIALSPSETPVEKRENIDSYRWDLRSLDGEIYDFNHARDKVVLVNFWATWCPPCLAEMPDMKKLYESYGDRVVFLFVTSEDPEEVKKFLDKRKWDLPVYTPLTRGPEKMYSSSIPATWVLDKKGNIVIEKKGAADWNSDKVRATLDRLLWE